MKLTGEKGQHRKDISQHLQEEKVRQVINRHKYKDKGDWEKRGFTCMERAEDVTPCDALWDILLFVNMGYTNKMWLNLIDCHAYHHPQMDCTIDKACIDFAWMVVYVSSVYKYTVNTHWCYVSSVDFPAARQDQFFHPSCRTMDTAAPLPTSLPDSTCLSLCARTQCTLIEKNWV